MSKEPALFMYSILFSGQGQSEGRSATAMVRQYLKNMSRKSSLERVVEKSRDNYGLGLSHDNSPTKPSGPSTPLSTTTKKTAPKEPPSSNSINLDHELKLRM